MTESSEALSHTCDIGMLVLPGFNAMASQVFIDPFRAANYLRGAKLYNWQTISLDSSAVIASNGLSITTDKNIENQSADFDLIVINASWTPEAFRLKRLQRWLKSANSAGSTLVSIDTGSFVLAYAGLLNGYRTTVHYEHYDAFCELFPKTKLVESLFVIDGERLACAGGMAACDLALEIIRAQQGVGLANAAAHYIFHDRLRAGDERQQSPTVEPVGYAVPALLHDAIILMERNLEEPLKLPDIAKCNGISQRQLERLFSKHTGKTPLRYYVDIRLDRARGLVTQTELPLAEVATACGFGSAEQFTRAYKIRFSIVPSKDRSEGRIPFQFRSYPGFAGLP